MIKIVKIIIVSYLAMNLNLSMAYAETIDITTGSVDPIPIAINEFAYENSEDKKYANKITEIIRNDLQNSGLFKSISRNAFIENKLGTKHEPLFAAWQQININLLLNARVKLLPSGKIKIKFILWDTIIENKLISETITLSANIWRRAGHKIADKIYEKVTGYSGYFDSRIVYVSEKGPYLKRVKRIAIMDQDGANHRYLTDGAELVLTPRFSPDGKKILYLSYKNNIPQVFTLDLKTNRTNLLGNFPGMSFAPRFSPDGKNVIMSIAKDGKTHIYEFNLKTRKKKQITRGGAIYTSPCYSPDGNKIVFNSDMSGQRRLYVMNKDGTNINRISSIGSYAEPNWSKTGNIVFTKISREFGFTIGVLNIDTIDFINSERLIASGYLVETPTWAPNGRLIAFAKGIRPGKKDKPNLSRIYTIDFTGYNERLIPTPHDASDPDWSNLR